MLWLQVLKKNLRGLRNFPLEPTTPCLLGANRLQRDRRVFFNNRSIFVSVIIPTKDGDVNCYDLSVSGVGEPRIYFVNGIRVLPNEHAVTAAYLSLLIERPVWGVYNQTAGQKLGSIVDVLQCVLDFAQNSVARTTSSSNLGKSPKVPENKIDDFLRDLDKKYVVWNQATLELFRQLVIHRHERQLIIAHSQGNLITSNALFVLEDVLGSAGLSNIRVYSLASPAPAWPLGLRVANGGGGRQDNAFMNDMVALLRPHNLAKKIGVGGFQNAGDFRTDSSSGPVALAPHDVNKIIESLNFLKSIRRDLGLPPELSPDFLRRAAAIAQSQIGSTGGASGSW
jgi:hypothetical protein